MSRLQADCCSLARQFHDFDFDVTLWINYPCSLGIATSPSFNPFTGARHEGSIKAIIVTILQGQSLNVQLIVTVEHTKVAAC